MVTIKLAFRLLRMARKHWGTLLIATLGLIGAAALNLITPQIVRQLTGALADGQGLTVHLIWIFCAILVGAYLLRWGCRFLSIYVSHLAAWRFVPELTMLIYNKLQHLSLRYFSDKQTGQLMSRMVNDTRQIEILVAHAIPDLVTNSLVIVGVTVMLFVINPRLALLTLIPVPLVIIAGAQFSKRVAPLFRINQQVLGELNGALQDNLSGMKEIQAFGQEERESAKMDKHRQRYSDVNIRANFANGIFNPGVEFMTSLGTVIVVGFGGYMAMQGEMPVSDIIGFMLYLSLFYQPLASLARLVEDVQNAYAGAVRVFEVLDAPSDVQEAPDALILEKCEGRVEFDNVDFAYNAEEPVLKGVSFVAEPGKMVALVGATGVGKTTIVSLLERFYDPRGGRVLLDGHDIRGLTLASLRGQISMVLQDVFLFNDTIAKNIAYGAPGATMEQVRQAAVVARADAFIRQMPDGYDTVVGERGVRLSGGQKQRIAIARAVLRDAPILVLDEATSAVDTQTEAEIQAAIEQLMGKRTVIVIAHRLSTVIRADQILVLQDGHVVQRGRHEELLREGGLYAQLNQTQWLSAKQQMSELATEGKTAKQP